MLQEKVPDTENNNDNEYDIPGTEDHMNFIRVIGDENQDFYVLS